ncbi:MAG: hypothetical protein R2801_05935 [Chitinophagales bacterium]
MFFPLIILKLKIKQLLPKQGTVWKIELEKPNLVQNGVKRQIYYLILFIDGTYMQQIYIEPENKKENFMITYFELEGNWTSNDKELILEEQGEKRTIDYETFYSKFEKYLIISFTRHLQKLKNSFIITFNSILINI